MSAAYPQEFRLLGTDSLMFHSKGDVHFSTILAHSYSEENHPLWDKPISITQFGTLVDYYLLNRIAVGAACSLAVPRGERIVDGRSYSANTLGLATALSLRIEVLNLTYHNFYLETQHGLLNTLDQFPPGGTIWNFMVKYGFGYTIYLAEKRYLNFGWRWMHISNGTGLVPTNPAYDGNGIYIGFKFAK